MGKKKGSKKGSKKKGGKKKGGKKSAVEQEPEETAPERFIKHQLEARAATIKDLREQRDELLEENADLQAGKARMLRKNDGAMDTIRDLQLAAERNLQAKSDELAEQMEEALKASQKAELENSAEIAELREKLLEVETDLAERAAHQELLEHHKHVLGSQWDSKINDLQEAVKILEDYFDENKSTLQRQFKTLKLHFEDNLELKLGSTKQSASNTALSIQPVLDRIAYQDNSWLRHEIQEQTAESERLQVACDQLQVENERLQAEVFGEDTVGGGVLESSPEAGVNLWESASFRRSLSASGLAGIRRGRSIASAPGRAGFRPQTHESTRLLSPPKSAMPALGSEMGPLKIFGNVARLGSGLRIVGEPNVRKPRKRTKSTPATRKLASSGLLTSPGKLPSIQGPPRRRYGVEVA